MACVVFTEYPCLEELYTVPVSSVVCIQLLASFGVYIMTGIVSVFESERNGQVVQSGRRHPESRRQFEGVFVSLAHSGPLSASPGSKVSSSHLCCVPAKALKIITGRGRKEMLCKNKTRNVKLFSLMIMGYKPEMMGGGGGVIDSI